MTAPLDGVRVLDLATMLAGPYAATLLGDLGADVVKVESHYGDDSRHLGPERAGQRSPFLSLNRNKRSLVLDLRQAEARPVFARLAATSDVVITNVREPALSKLGLAYEQVRAHRPDVIWVGVTAFGPDGPYAGRPGIDFLAQGYAGLLSLNGDPKGEPVRVTVPLVDVMTSELVVTGVLAALLVRARTSAGQRIDVSLLDALVHAQASGLGAWFLKEEITPRTGNRSQYFAPSGVYPCRDGKGIVITCPSDKFFTHLCRALEVDWVGDPRFAKIAARLEHQDALDALLAARCRDFARDDLLLRLIAADVLAAPIHDIPEVAGDPQVRHNDMIVATEHATLGRLEVTGVPVKLRGTPGSVRLAPPVHGQHTVALLAELGFGADEVAALRRARTIGVAE
ncbi:MAG: CoA transferase [Deltaproteobacteria bacterium]|nr:CoA transferase [Deltaproteobacteria bacterium]